ncbi:MAG TPA: maleylpyruvate isomerase N-terminal domain-containing protein [Dehalococcoidia bacterium]|jgi:hypothetical protein
MTTAAVLEAISRERSRLANAVASLGDRATTLPVTAEGWTAKDVLGHLLHWEGQVAFGLGAPIDPPAYLREVTGRPTGDEWNAIAVAFYKDTPLDDLRARHESLVGAIISQVGSRTDADMARTDAVPRAQGRPLWQFIAGDTFLHWPQHAAAIEAANAAAPSP